MSSLPAKSGCRFALVVLLFGVLFLLTLPRTCHAAANLTSSVSIAVPWVYQGESFEMEVAVSNIGDSPARNVKVEAVLLKGIAVCKSFVEAPQASQTVPEVPAGGRDKVRFQLLSTGPPITVQERLFDSSLSIGNHSLTARVTYDGYDKTSSTNLEVRTPTLVFSKFELQKNKVGLDGGETIDVTFRIDNKGERLPRIDADLLPDSAFDAIQTQKSWSDIGKDGSTGDQVFSLKTKKVGSDSDHYFVLIAKYVTAERTYVFAKKGLVEFRGGCLIATATFGSSLAPEVQFLREFRDYRVKPTFAGTEFLGAFNRFYYSFSPQVSDFLAKHESQRLLARVAIYPLIVSLSISEGLFRILASSPEVAVLVAGVFASSLLGIVYSLPVMLFRFMAKRLRS